MGKPLANDRPGPVIDAAGPTSAAACTVGELLAEADVRTRAGSAGQPAASLAVVEIRMPETASPDRTDALFETVWRLARGLGAWAAFDDDGGHFLLLLPFAPIAGVAAALEAALHQLSAVDVASGPGRALRPGVGAGLVELAGSSDHDDSVGEIDYARARAMALAQRSVVERALRVHRGAPDGSPPPRRTVGGFVRRRYLALPAPRKAWFLVAANLLIAWVVPFLVYSALYLSVGVDVSRVGFWVVLAAVVVTALTVYAEAVLALRHCSPPSEVPGFCPAASAIVVAYLPNETSTIVDTVTCILQQDYPGPIEVVLAYNTPRRLPIEKELAQLAARDPRLILLRVGDSTSKAQNINAALDVVQGEIIGIFDADHRPMATAFRRAAAWLADGADVVQGRSVVRNGDTNWLARMVAVEFEGIYAVAHPGRAALHAFGIFGGSNGFWRADLLDRLRMRPDMLTEDIDISIRAVFDGCRIVVDPTLISEELAPLTPMALWSQRIRWSHGWHQVSRLQVRHIWRARALTVRQRLGASFLLGWREAYPWVAAQMVPILAFSVVVRQQFHVRWLAPLFLLTTVYVSAVGPVQALFAWRLSVPELRRRHAWWWQYVMATGILFGEFKALVNRAAHVRELLGDRAWQVTPRTTDQSEGGVARLRPQRLVTEMVTMGPRPGTTSVVELDLPLRRPPAVELGLDELDADLSGLDPGEAVSS